MPTLADIAKLAGVGVMSVSRVVNGTRRVSPDVEERVRRALSLVGYVPNDAARVLKGNRSTVIGLIVPDLADAFFAELANEVQKTAWEAGYLTFMAASDHREELERNVTELMVQKRVAGILAVSVGRRNEHFLAAQSAGVPIIAVDRPMQHVTTGTLTVDNLQAADRATRHLLGHGYRAILCLADTERIHTKQQRVRGYSRAMRHARALPWVCLVGEDASTVSAILASAFGSKRKPGAIFATSNVLTVEVLHELHRMKVDIPGDVAVLGFDDFSAADLVTPPISVVRQPVAELGRRAAAMLFDRLQQDATHENAWEHVVLQTELILRGSCGIHQ